MRSMTVAWEYVPGPPACTAYFADDLPVGEQDAGFDAILESIRVRQIDTVILKSCGMVSTGSLSMFETLPFAARFEELERARDGLRIVFDFG